MAICALAIGNGAVREAALEPALGPTLGLVTSGLLLSVLVLAVAYAGAPCYGRQPATVLAALGVYWLVLTVAFELVLGVLVLRQSGDELLAQYSPAGGNLWLLVLATITIAPWLAARLRRLI
ncbi:hypothetical protein [Sediminicurvatus halobius]|uniref:Uncharacterized protein n=1 Tax=Sediminicurvatus halobius TaxID=2182432 RepID=A0A2U2N9P9_9GAMM|nr:hypothetical protein [Spiribacter halobius]PWG65800.1 hypothetical protein DEM34_00610 [Spiribacter halobius]UEX77842.1 hypothetical protein LMH63_18245 [Spiribacter halobius]